MDSRPRAPDELPASFYRDVADAAARQPRPALPCIYMRGQGQGGMIIARCCNAASAPGRTDSKAPCRGRGLSGCPGQGQPTGEPAPGRDRRKRPGDELPLDNGHCRGNAATMSTIVAITAQSMQRGNSLRQPEIIKVTLCLLVRPNIGKLTSVFPADDHPLCARGSRGLALHRKSPLDAPLATDPESAARTAG